MKSVITLTQHRPSCQNRIKTLAKQKQRLLRFIWNFRINMICNDHRTFLIWSVLVTIIERQAVTVYVYIFTRSIVLRLRPRWRRLSTSGGCGQGPESARVSGHACAVPVNSWGRRRGREPDDCSPGTESHWDDGHWVSQLRGEVENNFKRILTGPGSPLMIHTRWTWHLTFVHYILLQKQSWLCNSIILLISVYFYQHKPRMWVWVQYTCTPSEALKAS